MRKYVEIMLKTTQLVLSSNETNVWKGLSCGIFSGCLCRFLSADFSFEVRGGHSVSVFLKRWIELCRSRHIFFYLYAAIFPARGILATNSVPPFVIFRRCFLQRIFSYFCTQSIGGKLPKWARCTQCPPTRNNSNIIYLFLCWPHRA